MGGAAWGRVALAGPVNVPRGLEAPGGQRGVPREGGGALPWRGRASRVAGVLGRSHQEEKALGGESHRSGAQGPVTVLPYMAGSGTQPW